MNTRELILVTGKVGTYEPIRQLLENAGFALRCCPLFSAIPESRKSRPTLLIVDARFAYEEGMKVCCQARKSYGLDKIPILLIVGAELAFEEQRIKAFALGADDCIGEPLTPELLVRVDALLHHSFSSDRAESTDIVIDRAGMRVSVRGNEIPTTSLEFRLVDYLAVNRGKVFTRDRLLDAVWGEMQFVNPRSVDACVRRLRDKIEPDPEKPTYLKTIRGVGYRFDAIADWPEG
jgi:DNA-binding response OmpR family regulator